MNTKNYRAEAEKRYGLELIGDCFMRLLKKSSEQPFLGIRMQLAFGRLPKLALRFSAMNVKAGKEVVVS